MPACSSASLGTLTAIRAVADRLAFGTCHPPPLARTNAEAHIYMDLRGREVFDAQPGRFYRDRLEVIRVTYDQILTEMDAKAPSA